MPLNERKDVLMFNFNHVLNASTAQRYYIDKATLTNDEGYDETTDGANVFEIDLQPEDPNGNVICGIDLVICNDGAISITKNLDVANCHIPQGNNTFRSETVRAIPEGKTIVMINK
jgi:hypothetical protein